MNIWTFSRRGDALADSAIRALAKRITAVPSIVSFAGGMPSPETFPSGEFARAFDAVLAREGKQALQYGPTDGYLPLREWIAASLSSAGARFTPEQVLITSGSQQALDLVGKVFVDPGAPVAVESPTYLGATQALGLYEPDFVEVQCDADGLEPEDLELLLTSKTPRLLYVIPTFQNPTGRTLPLRRRTRLAELCAARQVPIVEDDPYRHLDYGGRAHQTLASITPDNVIYLGSFSKILSPGIRLGYVVAPVPVLRKLEMAKQASDLHTSTLIQRVVHEIVRGSFLDGHVAACRSLYLKNALAMNAALAGHLDGVASWIRPEGGMFQWVELDERIDGTRLLDDALAAGVAYVPGAPFYAVRRRENVIRLCFSTTGPEQIERGIAALAALVRGRLQ